MWSLLISAADEGESHSPQPKHAFPLPPFTRGGKERWAPRCFPVKRDKTGGLWRPPIQHQPFISALEILPHKGVAGRSHGGTAACRCSVGNGIGSRGRKRQPGRRFGTSVVPRPFFNAGQSVDAIKAQRRHDKNQDQPKR